MNAAAIALVSLVAGASVALAVAFARNATRLHLDVALKGSTRAGKLYLIVQNRRSSPLRDVRVAAAWSRDGGTRSPLGEVELGALGGHDATTVIMDRLHQGLEGAGWDAIEVVATARGVRRRSARVAVVAHAADGPEPAAEAPIRYVAAKDRPCHPPGAEHAFQAHRLLNDGIEETWRICSRCRFALRDPLTPEQEAAQTRARAARLQRMQREIDEEIARKAAEEGAAKARQGPRPRARARADDEPTLLGDALPLQVAIWILELQGAELTSDALETAHRRLAKRYHPDQAHNADPATRALYEERMRDINRARDRVREHLRS